jgi:TRAP-type mannitol/chloroaromatic compound transport system permease small subunit
LCVAIAWNAVVHLVVLQAVNASVQHLRRADLADKAWLSLAMTAGIVVMFVGGYGRVAMSGSVREGICYGLFFAVLAGLLVDLNQYVLFPIPGVVAIQWFAGGVIEFSLYGLIASRLYPPTSRASARGRAPGEPPP